MFLGTDDLCPIKIAIFSTSERVRITSKDEM